MSLELLHYFGNFFITNTNHLFMNSGSRFMQITLGPRWGNNIKQNDIKNQLLYDLL